MNLLARALVQSFLVPLGVYNSITATAVPEQQGGHAEVRNVDPTGAPNQYGFSGSAFNRMRSAIVPGSLITYVEDPSTLEGSGWGEVRRIAPAQSLSRIEVALTSRHWN